MTSSQPHNTLGKAERLKSRKQIDALFAGGKSFFVHPIKVVYVLNKNSHPINDAGFSQSSIKNHASSILQVGVSVSKRNFKKATDRNRIKRLLREAYRLNKHELASALQNHHLAMEVFFIYTHKTLPDFKTVEATLRNCLIRLQKTLEEQPK